MTTEERVEHLEEELAGARQNIWWLVVPAIAGLWATVFALEVYHRNRIVTKDIVVVDAQA